MKMNISFQGNRPVPVLIPEDLQPPLDFIANRVIRRQTGILDNNDYLFPVLGKSSGEKYQHVNCKVGL